MVVTIHQPEHMPWLGFFNKAYFSDVFVFLDSVQYRKNYFQNRNKIRSDHTNSQWDWLTIPLQKQSYTTLIKDRKILVPNDFKRKYLNKIVRAYQRTAHFDDYFTKISELILHDYEYLSDLNISLINHFFDRLKISCRCIRSSSLDLGNVKTGGIVNYQISTALGATTYISGVSGLDYLDETPFDEAGIEVLYQDFDHPTYTQNEGEFISHLSILDLLFHCGADSAIETIKNSGRLISKN